MPGQLADILPPCQGEK